MVDKSLQSTWEEAVLWDPVLDELPISNEDAGAGGTDTGTDGTDAAEDGVEGAKEAICVHSD